MLLFERCVRVARLTLLCALFGCVTQPLQAQLITTVDVEVTQEAGIYTYDYTLSNGFLSSSSINVFAVTVATGTDVALGTPFTSDEIQQGALGVRIDAPDGWSGAYDPRLVEFGDDDPDTPRNESCDVVGSRGLSDSFQVGWAAGDGFELTLDDPASLFPGTSLSYSVQSRYAPSEQSYLVANLDDTQCPNLILALAEGTVLAPTIPPTTNPTPEITCDFDGDGDCDLIDIDTLSRATASGENEARFDLNGDLMVNTLDINAFLESDQVQKLNGDSDFNDAVEFADFLLLSTNFGQPAVWTAGDFDGGGVVDFADFLLLADNFGDTFAANGVLSEAELASVPEPSAGIMLTICLLFGSGIRRSRYQVAASTRRTA